MSLVQDGDALCGHAHDHHHGDHDNKSDADGLTPQERHWLQMEEDEGPGAYEREIELLEDMKRDGWAALRAGRAVQATRMSTRMKRLTGTGGPYALWPVVSQSKGTGRKQSVDSLEPDADKDGQALGECGGTPPKRARTVEPSPRLVKRHSEELDFDEWDAETAKYEVRAETCAPREHRQPVRHEHEQGVRLHIRRRHGTARRQQVHAEQGVLKKSRPQTRTHQSLHFISSLLFPITYCFFLPQFLTFVFSLPCVSPACLLLSFCC
jgi:hypothetical protein